MRGVRILSLAVLAAAALTASSASAAPLAGPTGLHGFLLRADEPAPTGNVFSRTPAFAWNPTPGATGYEFQLSTSNAFTSGGNTSDNSILYDTNSLTSPVVAPPLVLPWISGRPHSLYARVRATTPAGVTAWSADYGFDLAPDPLVPTPLPAGAPGLLRWTPVEGADAYQVWLVDLPNGGKIVKTRTNVLDEREFYTFHGSSQWVGSIRWRIRAVRSTEAGGPANGLPVSSYSQWSPIYRSTNPGLTNPPLGQDLLAPVSTISDVVEDGANPHDEAPHKLMPAFAWRGSQVTLPNGSIVSADLFRVEIFSDRACLNLVYAGPIVGGRSWAPRPWGSLSLAQADTTAYAPDGSQGLSSMFDGTQIQSAEDLAPAGPTGSAPPDAIPAGATQAVTAQPDPATFGPRQLPQDTTGAPVDLWDTYWPDTGYYWTVMPVAPALGSAAATVASPGASKGSTLVPVSDSSQFADGENITIGVAPNSDTATITAVGNQFLTVSTPMNVGHAPGDPIVVLGSTASAYRDLLLPQDLCGQGLEQEFGIWSEPTVASPQAPFVTGLSSTGRLVSATSSSQFYGRPLVAWTPALGAEKYEIEWSSSDSPFVAAGNILTTSTAAVLPLTAGTWYYRVRGFDYNLPSGAQQMAWSQVQQIVVSKPVFKVLTSTSASTPATPTRRTSPSAFRVARGNGFSLTVPRTWQSFVPQDSVVTFQYRNPAHTATVNVLQSSGPAGRSLTQWEADLRAQMRKAFGSPVAASIVTLPAGKAVELRQTISVKGKTVSVVQYDVVAGSTAFDVTFTSAPSAYATNAPTFARMIAGFRVG
jgi:hypothetical protein